MDKNNNIKALDEINKGACMGVDAVNFILEQSEDKELNSFLEDAKTKYERISKRINKDYENYSDEEIMKTNTMNKVMTWYSIKLKTITDSTSSKLAELLFQGFNMGIAEGRKLLNHKDVSSDVHKLIQDYVTLQEEFAERVKDFL